MPGTLEQSTVSILTIKLNYSQRDALATLVRSRMATCTAGADADTAQAQANYASELSSLRETLAELTERARDYSAEARLIELNKQIRNPFA